MILTRRVPTSSSQVCPRCHYAFILKLLGKTKFPGKTFFLELQFLHIFFIKPQNLKAIHLNREAFHMWLEGCPSPNKMEQKLGVHFFETLYPYEDKIRMKKIFHQWTSEIQASMHGRSSPSRLDWPCTLAGTSEVQRWNFFLLTLYSYG